MSCPTTPFSAKTNPYSAKASVFTPKISPFTAAGYCPILLQENGRALLLESGGNITL